MTTTPRDRGATLPIVALLLPVLILMTAFAVDLGRQRSSRRTMQARADIIALDMVRLADGRDAFTIYSDSATEAALLASAARNGIARSQITEVVWGRYNSSLSPLPFQPYHQAQFAPANDPTLVPDAVKITTVETTNYFFQPGSGNVTRTAVATQGGEVDLQVGSVAAGFQATIPGGSAGATATVAALNARLGATFGATVPSPGAVALTAASYQGLAASDIDLGQMAQSGGFASPNELLAEELTVGEFFALTAAALDQQAAEGDPNAASAATQVRGLSTSIGSSVGLDSTNTIRLGDFLTFAQGGDDAAVSESIKVLDLLSGAADVIDGKHFLSYSFNPGISGVARANVQQYLVTPPQWARNLRVGGQSTNKQMGFQITLDVAPLLGMSGPVTVPIIVDAATATGTVDAIRCGAAAADREVDIDVDTSVLTARVGSASNVSAGDFTAQVGVVVTRPNLTLSAMLQLGVTGLLSITNDLKAQGTATLGGANDQLLTFTPDVPPNPFQRAQGGVGATGIGTQLSNNLQAQYGLSLLSGAVSSNLASQLSYVFSNLDNQVVGPLLRAAGLTVGGADVGTANLECNALKLVG